MHVEAVKYIILAAILAIGVGACQSSSLRSAVQEPGAEHLKASQANGRAFSGICYSVLGVSDCQPIEDRGVSSELSVP